MKKIKVTCPECNHQFSPDQSIKHQLDHLMEDERNKLHTDMKQKEEAIQVKNEELRQRESSIDEVVNEKLQKEQQILENKLKEKALTDVGTEIKAMKAELEEKQEKLNKAKELELENARIKRQAKEREADIRLQVEKEMIEKQTELERQIIRREAERQEMKLAEKEKQLTDLKKQLEEARRRAEQGSVQMQGEVQEIALAESLDEVFKFDSIEEVPKGTNGADILQTVRTQFGRSCGLIAFESKRTKNWSEGWITKLKEDMRSHGASHGIIVTEVMPKDMPTFGNRDGIWVCSFKEVVGLTAAIRQICITETTIKASEKNKDSKVHALYNYLMSIEFKQRVEGIIQAVGTMKSNVEKERKSMLAFWKKQEVQIDQMNYLMLDIIGSIDGLSGNALGPIRGLELDQGNSAA